MGSTKCGLLLLFVTCIAYAKGQENATQIDLVQDPEAVDRSIIYYITAPVVIKPFSQYPISVTITNSSSPVDITLTVKQKFWGIKDQNDTAVVTTSGKVEAGSTVRFTLDVKNLDTGSFVLEAKGQDQQGHNFTDEASLTVRRTSNLIFIQTDKPLYKLGDTVKYRILAVDLALKPVQIPLDVKLYDPQRNLIQQNLQVNSANATKSDPSAAVSTGYFEGQLQLASEAPLGSWTIEVTAMPDRVTTKTFTVEEYVLPRFDVQLKAPEYIIKMQDSFEVTLNSSYTFGQPVKGKAFIQVDGPSRYQWETRRDLRLSKTYELSDFNGFAKITVYVADVVNRTEDFSDYNAISVSANVTEGTTHTVRSAKSKSVSLKRQAYKLDMIKATNTFKPGFPYTITVTATQWDGRPIPPTTRKMVVKVSQSTSAWGSGYFDEELKEFTVPVNGSVDLTVVPSKETRSLFFRARLGRVKTSQTVSGYDSPSNSFMQIFPQSKNLSVGDTAVFAINLTNSFPQLNYTVFNKGQILAEGNIATSGSGATVSLPLDRNYTPRSRLLAYYIRDDSEVVANVIDFEVSGLIQNNVTVTVHPENRTDYAEPGERAVIKIETAPKSFVGLLAMDQSLLLLKQGNDISESDIVSSFGEFDYDTWSFDNAFGSSRYKFPGGRSVFRFLEQAGLVVLANAAIPGNPKIPDVDEYHATRGVMYSSAGLYGPPPSPIYLDSLRSAPEGGMMMAAPAMAMQSSANFGGSSKRTQSGSSQPEPRLRKDFRETFLYETFNSENGSIEITRDIPDTITSWVCSAFSMNNEVGLGITKDPPKLRVFRPFFAVLNLPFSIIRGETVQLEVLVFNYLAQDQNVQVTLDVSGQDANGNKFTAAPRTKQITVKSQESLSVTFPVKPEVVGEIDIKATAVAEMAGDSLVRKLKVKPEGVRQQFNAPLFIDLRKENSFSSDVLIPLPDAGRVEGSEKLVFTSIGDLLGPTIYGINNLIRLPYGCGEQNMALFAPNVFVMKYLKSADRLDDQTREKLLRNLRSGYQRQLTFKHYDKSYSAFGDSDNSGSTFLTAFVARTFFQAKDYITIDENIIKGALDWLADKQADNGSFPEVGKVFDRELQGGAGKGTALTAYVLITLLEAQSMGNYSENIKNATRFLEAQTKGIDTDPYALSIVNYALQLAGSNGLEFTSSRLEALAIVANGTKHWAKEREIEIQGFGKYHWEYKLPAKDVEMTAYGLLSAIRKKDVEGGFPILAWLLSKRNEQGGYQTSQDTVVGLQAISEFAQLALSKDRDITVHITAEDFKSDFTIKDENALVLQTAEPKKFYNRVIVEASGKGTALVQVSWIYYIRNTSNEQGFAVTTKITKGATELLLQFCTNYQGQNDSNMAVMETSLPSGYQVDEEEVKKLTAVVKDLSRVDIDDDHTRLTFYFDKLTKDKRCLIFTGYRKFNVDNLQDSNVVVYNYYNPIEKQTAFYNPKDAQ
ncbi:CD109 antigen-like isoform X2 [Paramacrobiotus metropolitanus]|uniref:CD109 antigen-like isoform X2 n=1 Tax=Paramacrobiotus metropolitanus TaxID=2943436 RepID=UPI0024459D9C|nr:CD109 antigen-like isoform X2 [Paramacrobiotus metropolitanus]